MAERHGIALWPGVNGFISCSYTQSHGISPGVAALTIPEQDVSRIASYGMLVITDGVGTVKLPRCKLIDVQFSGGGGSPRTITLLIADRRWMWKFGGISGNWNQIDPYPDPDSFPPGEFIAPGGPYMPGTYRTAEKLLADCLAALNEVNPLISPPPQVPIAANWDNETPAAAMQAICDTLGYRIVYRHTIDQVAIVPAGVGIPLPVGAGLSVISGSDGIDPPERPNSFQLVGGDTVWNDWLELEPVTLEQNGAVVKLDDASYKPSIGWGRSDPLKGHGKVLEEHGPEKCALANKHVWRTFRIRMRDVATWQNGFIDVPQFGRVTDRKQIVLGSQVFGTTKDERGQQRTEPPYVAGSVFYARSFERPANGTIVLGAFGNTVVGSERIPAQPSIDSARGLVTFDRALFRNEAVDATTGAATAVPSTGAIGEPALYIRTSFRIRNLAGMVFDKFKAGGSSPVAGDPLCPPEYLRHPELVAVINVTRSASPVFLSEGGHAYLALDSVTDNLSDLRRAADYYLDAADQQYRLTIASERTYAGILPLLPDGAIQQVTWKVGGGPATTQASRNTEHSPYIQPFAERRSKERVNNFWGKQAVAEKSASLGGGLTSPGALNQLITFGVGGIFGNSGGAQ